MARVFLVPHLKLFKSDRKTENQNFPAAMSIKYLRLKLLVVINYDTLGKYAVNYRIDSFF